MPAPTTWRDEARAVLSQPQPPARPTARAEPADAGAAPPPPTIPPTQSWREEAAAMLAASPASPDTRSTFARAVDVATTPLLPQLATSISKAAEAIDEPTLDRGPWRARSEGFLRGAVEGAGQLVTQLTSPLDLGLTLATGGSAAAAKRGLSGLRSAFRAAEVAGGAALTARGAERAMTGDSLADRAAGLLEVAGGAAALAPRTLAPASRGSAAPAAPVDAAAAPAIAPSADLLHGERVAAKAREQAPLSTAALTPTTPDDTAYRALEQRLRVGPDARQPGRQELYAWLADAREAHGSAPWFRDALRTVSDPDATPEALAALARRHGVTATPLRTDAPELRSQAALEGDAASVASVVAASEASHAPPPIVAPGERGSLSLSAAAPPAVTAAEVRSPDPAIEARFAPPGDVATAWARVRQAWNGARDMAGRAVRFEHDLKKAGLTDAVDRLDTFARERADAPRQILGELETVLTGLDRPAQYHAFQRIVMLRRDLELADAMEAGRLARRPLESGLTPDAARAELGRLEALAAREPQILEAADRHRALVRATADDLVDRGLMQADTRDRNAEYFPGLVWDRIADEASLAGRPLSPLTPGVRGFLKQAKGGERRTVRDYLEAMSRHLAEVRQATMRDDLVKDLAERYDRSEAVAGGAAMPEKHSLWSYAGESYLVPDALRSRLQQFTRAKSPEVRAMNRATAWWKRTTLRVLGVPYELLNFSGDLVNFLVSEPLGELAKAPARMGRAARATRLAQNPPKAPTRFETELLAIAELGERMNLGTGGATAEIGRAVAERPALRALVRPLEDEPASRRLARLPGDLVRGAVGVQDRFREFRENVPRLAKFMAEIERGQTPEAAARVTRKELIDYTRLTDFERTWLRGALMPFVTWFKKNFENWMPGLREGADGTRRQGAIEAMQRTGKVLVPAYAVALYNETFFPEVEKNLSDIDRYRFHVLVPWNDGTLYVGLTGPANAAASFVGLQGFTQRSLDLARGRSTIGEEAARSGRQVRQSVLGLLSPLATEPVEQVMNRDLRSGREIVPARPARPTLEALGLRLKHAAERFAPVAQVIRSADETTGASETAGELARRLTLGNLVKPVDAERDRLLAISRAVRTGERRAEGAREGNKQAALERLGARFRAWGPERTDRELTVLWPELKHQEAQLMIRALRALADSDRRFLAAATRWRLEEASVSDAEAPFVAEQLKRKGLTRSPGQRSSSPRP